MTGGPYALCPLNLSHIPAFSLICKRTLSIAQEVAVPARRPRGRPPSKLATAARGAAATQRTAARPPISRATADVDMTLSSGDLDSESEDDEVSVQDVATEEEEDWGDYEVGIID